MLSDLTPENLINDYCVLKLPKAEIARKYNTTTHTIYTKLKKLGIPTLKPIERTPDLTGMKFGKLTIIGRGGLDSHGKGRWNCQCDCGNKHTVNSSSLIRKLTVSCGCHRSNKNRTGYKEISGAYWRRIVNNAQEREIEFSLTIEYIWELYGKQNRMCALTGLPIKFGVNHNKPENQTASIDRIDSQKNYIEGNVQLVHKTVNWIKGWLNQDEFILICNLIAKLHPINSELPKSLPTRIFKKQHLRKIG